jgi:hypothetical protein
MFPVAAVNLGQREAQQLQLEWIEKWNAEAQAVLQDDGRIVSLGLADQA